MGCRLLTHTAPGTSPGRAVRGCTLNAVGLLPVSRAWRCEGRPPLPHHFVCVETFTLPYLTLRFTYSMTYECSPRGCVRRRPGSSRPRPRSGRSSTRRVCSGRCLLERSVAPFERRLAPFNSQIGRD